MLHLSFILLIWKDAKWSAQVNEEFIIFIHPSNKSLNQIMNGGWMEAIYPSNSILLPSYNPNQIQS